MALEIKRFFRRRYWPAWLTLVLGLAATGWLTVVLYRQAKSFDEQRFKLETEILAQVLEGTMERYEERLARLADYCGRFDELPARVWDFRRSEMTDLSDNLPSVMLAAYCLKVDAANFDAHAAHGRDVKGGRYNFNSQPVTNRDLALPVWHAWPRPGFVPIELGTDMAENTEWHPSLIGGLGRATAWVSPDPVRVPRKDGKSENGFWFVISLFKPDQQPLTPSRLRDETDQARAQRRREFHTAAATGVLAAFISMDRMDVAINGPKVSPRIHVRIYASRAPSPERVLNPVSEPPVRPRHRRLFAQSWYGRSWLLEMTSTPRFEADSPRYLAWTVMVAGTGMTLLASALLVLVLRARSHQERMTEQIREARDALAAAQQERQKLSHDLHDNTIQTLYAIQLGLNHTSQKLEAQPASARRDLAAVRAELDAVITEIRRFITAEEGPDMAADLSGVLRSLVERARVGTSAQIEARCDPEASDRLAGDQAVQLANIAREALSNSLRHGRPRQVQMALRSEPDAVCLEVFDDGTGFNPESQTRGVGLTSMTTRAREIGAGLDIQSAPDKGTRVMIRVPVSPLEHAEAQCTDAEPDES